MTGELRWALVLATFAVAQVRAQPPRGEGEVGRDDAGAEDAGREGAGREDAGREGAGREDAGREGAGAEGAGRGGPDAEDGAPEGDENDDGADQATREAARARFRRGVELARAGDCRGALAELHASHRLVPRPNTLFNIARCQEELLRYDRAVADYERYLEIAPTNAADRAAVEATMRSLRNLLGTVVVASNVTAEVWVGDRQVGEAPGEVLVPGGTHAFELRADGYLPARREVEVAGRERTEVSFTLERGEVNVTNVHEQTVNVTEEGGAPPALFFTGVGLTAASLAVAAGFGIRALSLQSDAEARDPVDRPGIEALNDDRRRSALLGDVFWGVTGALGITTLVLFFLTDFDGDPEETAVRIGPGGVSLEGRF